ncbi:hypothetical protein [Streptomyces sp. NPDC046805]|uniref:hypothetical protein n=1 Tax=Streptomyces sp. NPDC046805 TaxID=3155134 RepID=UPI0033C2A536
MTGSIEQGTSRTRGSSHILQFLVRLPRSMGDVWPALATPAGLAGWLTAADPFEPRLGGHVALRDLGRGRITAWDVDRVVEYTLEDGGRIRFHLEREGEDRSVLRFTTEFQDDEESEPRWRARFERLIEILESARDSAGHPR